MSRSRHSQDDMAVTITITMKVQVTMLTASSEAKEGPEKLPKLPIPSHPGWGTGALQQWRPAEVEKLRSSGRSHLPYWMSRDSRSQ